MEQELLALLEYLSSSPVFSGVRVTRSLVVCVCFVDRCLFFCVFSVCLSSIYEFWLTLVSFNPSSCKFTILFKRYNAYACALCLSKLLYYLFQSLKKTLIFSCILSMQNPNEICNYNYR